jgi:hypothetical protein
VDGGVGASISWTVAKAVSSRAAVARYYFSRSAVAMRTLRVAAAFFGFIGSKNRGLEFLLELGDLSILSVVVLGHWAQDNTGTTDTA